MLRAFAILTIVASPRFAAAELPAAGVLGVTNRNVSIQIIRIKPTGIEKVAERRWGDYAVQDLGFSDAKTLWVALDDSDGTKPVRVEKIVDGKLVDTITITGTDLKRPYTADYALMFGSAGEVWIESCDKRSAVDERLCLKGKGDYVRVDTKPFQKATKPARIDDNRGAKLAVEGTAAFPAQKPPKDYAVKLDTLTVAGRSVKGIVCTGPAGAKLSWPTADEVHTAVSPPTKITWLLASPPIVRVDLQPNATFQNVPVYILACQEHVTRVHSFGRDLWGIYRHVITDDSRGHPQSKQFWTVYSREQAIGTIDGTNLRVAPW